MAQCMYEKSNYGRCSEKALLNSSKGYCIFHEGLENKDVYDCMDKFYEKIRNGETDFEGYILKDVNLDIEGIKKIGRKNKTLNFRTAIFSGDTDFYDTNFLGGADFIQATFLGDAIFNSSTFSGDAIFNSSTFSEKADFSFVTFSGETHFEYVTFPIETDFYCVTFLRGTRFNHTTFLGHTEFTYSTFSEKADFENATFRVGADFAFTKFLGDAFFKYMTSVGEIGFMDTTFSGKADFSYANFEKIADFSSSTFKENGSFVDAKMNFTIFSKAELRHVRFDNVNLTNAELYGALLEDAYVSGAIFRSKKLREEKEALYGRKMCGNCFITILFPSKLLFKIQNLFMRIFQLNMKNINLIIILLAKNLQKLLDIPLFLQSRCEYCGTPLTEHNITENVFYIKHRENFWKAEDVYRKLKLSLQNEGEYENASEFYYREMKMRRKKNYHDGKFGYWVFNHLYSKICGYGEKPIRVILTALLIILGYAFLYHHFQAITTELTSQNIGLSEALYFSIVTFTTLGYGDYHPMPTFQLLTTTEALIGAFMMALFVLVFGRKMLR